MTGLYGKKNGLHWSSEENFLREIHIRCQEVQSSIRSVDPPKDVTRIGTKTKTGGLEQQQQEKKKQEYQIKKTGELEQQQQEN